MRKFLCKIMAAVMMVSVLAGFTPAVEAKAADAITAIPLTVVNDITYEAVDAKVVGDTVTNIGGNEATAYRKQFSLTLAKPAYVKLSVHSTVMYDNYNNLGPMVQYKLSYNTAATDYVKGTSHTEIWGNENKHIYLVLDAGTYYFTVNLSKGGSYKSSGDYSVSALVQYMNATTRNITRDKAKTVSTDKLVTDRIDATARTRWYKFTLASASSVSITSYLDNAWSGNMGSVKSAPMAVTLWNSRRQPVKYWNSSNVYGTSTTQNNIQLEKGTYYLSFYADQQYDSSYWGTEYKLESNGSAGTLYNGGELSFKVTTIKTPTSLKATNQSGKKVKLTYKKPTGAKGFEVQYSTDKNFKTGVTTKTATKTTYTISKLTKNKTYYIRVRAWKYNEDGEKLYSSWATKSVKIKK